MNENKTENISIKDIPSFLNTDLYNVRVCERNWKQNFSENEVHEMFFRTPPYDGNNFVIAVGMPYALRFLKSKIENSEYQWLINQGYSEDFAKYLLTFGADFFKGVNIWSVEEGTIVFPNEPVMRIEGPSNAVQMLETYFLSQVGYPSLIATKALRCVWAARQFKKEVLLSEYGLRRSQTNAGHFGARSAYVAGFAMTSNALAGKIFGVPVSGSGMMHADVQRRENEKEAFKSFYEYVSYKNKVIFLIDTYDVLRGAKNAVDVAKEMRNNSHELYGVRIDSGDLKKLIPAVRKIFSNAGFPDIKILVSGDMNEYKILELAKKNVFVDMFGIGTELITGGEKPALGMVYKLKGIIKNNQVIPKIKISADKGKTTLPGSHQIFRIYDNENGLMQKDIIGMHNETINGEKLLKQIVFDGNIIEEWEISDVELTNIAKERALSQINLLPQNILNFEKKDIFPVEVSEKVKKETEELIEFHKAK